MNRRLFLLTSLAGVVDPRPPLGPLDQRPSPVNSGDPNFDAWAQGFFQRALASGYSEGLLRAQLSNLTPDPRVTGADTRQPEFSRPISDYIRLAVSDDKVAIALKKRELVSPWLPGIEARFGVPAGILIAIWGMESGFGAMQGDFDVVRSVASLAAQGRRREWAESQLLACMRIISSGLASRPQMRGSWAGAMGQTQFEPETFLNLSVDIDGDGRRDIWGSSADALGSAANVLANSGWRPGESWAREALLTEGFDYSQIEGPRHTPDVWSKMGAKIADGRPLSKGDLVAECGLILPSGAGGPAFLVFPNHFVIRTYNNSTSYALAVGLFADRVSGAAPLMVAWPHEAPVALADRIGSQKALKVLGFDPGDTDGAIGVNSRAALRAWQKARGFIPDGHLTPELAQRLQREAGLGGYGPPVSNAAPVSSQ